LSSFFYCFSLGIDASIDENADNECGIRLNTVHVRGVNDMSTQRVFNYFAEFAASAIEWVDDASCGLILRCVNEFQLKYT